MTKRNGGNFGKEVKPIDFEKTEDNMKDIANIVKLNNDITELVLSDDKKLMIENIDIDHQIEKAKNNNLPVVTTPLYENKLDFSKVSPFSEDQIVQDYIYVMDNVKASIEVLKNVVKQFSVDLYHPNSVTNLIALMKEIRSNEEMVMKIHDRIIKNRNNQTPDPNKTQQQPSPNIGNQTNNTFVVAEGQTMHEILKNTIKNTVEISQAEVINEQ
jgi:hypothetical protein